MQPGRAGFGAASQRALVSAYRRATLHGAGVIGTEYLLVSALDQLGEPAGDWRALPVELWHRRARTTEAQHAEIVEIPEPADLEVDGALREAAWRGWRVPRRHRIRPEWHPGVRAALSMALTEAGAAGRRCVAPRDLAEAVLADPRGAARELARAVGLDADRLLATAKEHHPEWSTDEPPDEIAGRLKAFRVLDTRLKMSWFDATVTRPLFAVVRRTRMDPVLIALEMEAIRQAVRLGAEQVHTGHLLLAMLELDRNLAAVGERMPESLAATNAAGSVLAEHGVDYDRVARRVGDLPAEPESPVVPIGGPWWWRPSQRRWWRTNVRNPSWAVSAGEASDGAQLDAKRSDTPAGSSHLLIRALADPDGPASQVLRQLGAEPAAVAAETARRLPM